MANKKEIIDEKRLEEAVPGQLMYISVDKLYPHPYNPRKDVGDVTELAESLKAKGILQNLTVVPAGKEGHYIILIGHRRYNAAKLAGITELPCAVVEMSMEDQIATMLIENMQRSDLTVYEEAKGFQLMLDLGKSVKEVSDMSGFSETTIRKRVKLAALDEKKFKKAVDRGATLFDFAELDKIEDAEVKSKLLDSMGKADFKNELKRALESQKNRKKIDGFISIISKWATQIDKLEWGDGKRIAVRGDSRFEVKYIRNFGYWAKENEADEYIPEDANTVAYYFIASAQEVDIYRGVTDEDRKERDRADAEQRERRAAEKATEIRFIEITKRHYELRKDFILGFNQFKTKAPEVAQFISQAMMGYEDSPGNDLEELADLLRIHMSDSGEELDYREYTALQMEQPEKVMLLIAFWLADSEDNGYWERSWGQYDGEWRYAYIYEPNEQLDNIYRILMRLGYSISTEERQMRDCTHSIFETKGD